jgi:hypothetical protein
MRRDRTSHIPQIMDISCGVVGCDAVSSRRQLPRCQCSHQLEVTVDVKL